MKEVANNSVTPCARRLKKRSIRTRREAQSVREQTRYGAKVSGVRTMWDLRSAPILMPTPIRCNRFRLKRTKPQLLARHVR